MAHRLQFIDSFPAHDEHGHAHTVRAYEHQEQPDWLTDGLDHWESTGRIEYRLADGEPVQLLHDGSLRTVHGAATLRLGAAQPKPSLAHT